MNKYYTHPEDSIHKTKTFINELQTVQETYFNDLVSTLKLNKAGEDFLFDYIYNYNEGLDDFSHYLQDFDKKYEDFVAEDVFYNPSLTLLSVPEAYPSMHMSSYEADLETSFPSHYDDKDQISCELLTSLNPDILNRDTD